MNKMKKMKYNRFPVLLGILLFFAFHEKTTGQEDTAAGTPVVRLHYFNNNNSMQYLLLESLLKKGRVLSPQKNKTYSIFLDSGEDNLIAEVQTDENGKAKAFIPPQLKTAWDSAALHTFTVKEGDEEVLSDFTINKARITLDTASADGVKNITVSVMKLENNEWLPAADVEMKVGIKRTGGLLPAGDEETYTTDSSGTVVVELKRDSLPGDPEGNIVIAARVEDNDQYGNLLAEKKVVWGVPGKVNEGFFEQRTLWSTRFRAPVWLLVMAYSIICGVWGTLIYLVVQLVKVKKLGTQKV